MDRTGGLSWFVHGRCVVSISEREINAGFACSDNPAFEVGPNNAGNRAFAELISVQRNLG
jgi:hypothetical protein